MARTAPIGDCVGGRLRRVVDFSHDLQRRRRLDQHWHGSQDIPGETFWVLTVGADNVIIRVNGTAIQFQVVIAGKVTEATKLYDAVAHRWWRVREAEGVFYLETSPNGDAWTEQLQQSHSLDLSAVRSGLVMHTNKITGAFEGPQFDNVNVLP